MSSSLTFEPQTTPVTFPAALNDLSPHHAHILQSLTETRLFQPGASLFQQGEAGDGCYILDEGLVRIELESEVSNPDDQEVFAFVEAGNLLGELSLLDGSPRSAHAIAHTEVKTRFISRDVLEHLKTHHPIIALAVLQALGQHAAARLRQTTHRLDSLTSAKSDPRVEEMLNRAEAAQREFVHWSEARIDALLHDIAHAVNAAAVHLAEEAVRETGIGNVPDKVAKNRVSSVAVYAHLAGKSGYGAMETPQHGQTVLELANPVGVVFGIVPVTNPTSTFVFKVLIALKARNAIILSPNRRAAGVSAQVGEIIREVLAAHGAPLDIVQWVDARASRKLTITFMNHKKVGLILATGGPAMVRAAYSSGNPAIGVGAGNAPVYIAPDADFGHAAVSIVASKSFDHGLICGSEHNLIVHERAYADFAAALEASGAAILTDAEAAAFRRACIDPRTGGFVEQIIGQSAQFIAERVGISRPDPIRLLVVPVEAVSASDALCKEKMTPVLSLFSVPDDEAALNLSQRLLAIDGAGHTAIIHSRDEALIRRFGLLMPASRILVNSPGTHGVIGMTTDLLPSLTLGCGTFGGNSTTDNVGFRNLMNIKRVAYFNPQRLEALAPLLEG